MSRDDIGALIKLIAKLALIPILVYICWWVIVHGGPDKEAQRREQTINECVAAFEYSRAQCIFIVDHPRLIVR